MQNKLEYSKKSYTFKNSKTIEKSEGDFILQYESPHFCNITNTLIGFYVTYAKRFKTQEQAEVIRQIEINKEGYDSYENHIRILNKDGIDIEILKFKKNKKEFRKNILKQKTLEKTLKQLNEEFVS